MRKNDIKGPLDARRRGHKEVKPASDKGPAVKARMVIVGDSDFAVNSYFGATRPTATCS